MTKTKKQRKPRADNVYAKKAGQGETNPFAAAAAAKKINPFEVHVNREKFQILGRTCKHDKGLPGVSRAKAIKRRTETLGQEFQVKHKTNQFRDRRIGKKFSGPELSEDVLNARFLAEKMSQLKQSKASRFNLDDDVLLTHRGQTLEEIEQFHDERSDDEGMDEEGLDASFTEAAHFGGDRDGANDRKTAIEDMIIEQKKKKIEVAKEKEEIQVLTTKLDSNYKELIGLMGKMSKNDNEVKPKPDDYDVIMRGMIFEAKGGVSDKLVSEAEQAKREKERLEKLEQERLKRMQSDNPAEEGKPTHRSADDLDDGYFANGAEEEEETTLAYNLDGELGTKLQQNGAEEEEEEASDASDESDKDEGEDEEENDNDNGSSDDDEDAEDDNLSDLKESDEEDEDEPEQQTQKQKKTKDKKDTIGETADLPFTIEMPASYEALSALLNKHTPENQATIVERLIKCNHPKLEGVNREKVVKMFAYLLQYINEIFCDASPDDVALQFRVLSSLNPHLFDLMHLNPEKMSTNLRNVIKEKYNEYRKNSKNFPGLETLIYFKLVSNFFTTSDFQHPVVTPCFVFIQHILSKARLRTRQDVASGLFLATVALEYTHQSKRFLPAVFNFLLGVIYLSVPKRTIQTFKVPPPFIASGPLSKLLVVADKEDCVEELLNSEDLVVTTLTTPFKIRAFNMTLKIIQDAITNVKENVGSNYLAEPLLDMLKRVNLEPYPEFVQRNYEATLACLQEVADKTLVKIVPPEKKPKALRLLEPRIETVYDDKRRPKLTKEKEEKVKLLHKLKRETKGAVREIRRDTQFLQNIRIKQQMQSDMERREKVKRIYQEASVQQGELNELARSKKKKKF